MKIKLGQLNEIIRKAVKKTIDANVWYHTTTIENFKKISTEGLKVNSAPNYSISSLEYMQDVYQGIVPIFVSKKREKYDNDNDAIFLQVNLTGFDEFLAADVPTLISNFGAYMSDNESLYFESDETRVPPDFTSEEDIPFEEFLPGGWAQEAAINLTKTAAVLRDIPLDRIQLIKR